MATIKLQPLSTRRNTAPVPDRSGEVACQIFSFTLDEDVDYDADIIELGVFPAGAIPVQCDIVAANLASGDTLTVGFMSGTPNTTDTDRTSGSEFFSAQAGNAAGATSVAALAAISAATVDRSIGLKLGQDVTGGATKKVYLRIMYVM